MSGRYPFLQWYPSDYISDFKTARLSLEEHGAYHLLLWHMWNDTDEQCVFPLDHTALGGIWRLSPKDAERIVGSLMTPRMRLLKVVKRRTGPLLFSQRLHDEHAQALRKSEQQSTKGKRSGVVRRANAVNRGSTAVEPDVNRYPRAVEPVRSQKSEPDTDTEDPAKTAVSSAARGEIAIVGPEFERLTGQVVPEQAFVAMCADHPTDRLLEAVRRATQGGNSRPGYIAAIARDLAAKGWRAPAALTTDPNQYEGWGE